MYQVAICDDSARDREILRQKLLRVEKYHEQLKFFEYASGEELLKAIEFISFSIVFLDIQMKGMDGEETASKIRNMDSSVVLVFITGNAEPTYKTFHAQAYRYIKKNMSDVAIRAEIEASLDYMAEVTQRPTIYAKVHEQRICLQLDDIVWIEKNRNSVLIHITEIAKKKYDIALACGSKLPIRGNYKLKELYQKLKMFGYGNPHDSYIINFKYLVASTKNEIRLEGYNERFTITRSKAAEFNRLKKEYFSEKYRRNK